MTDAVRTESSAVDGRTARRTRGRIAVVDAAFELLQEQRRRPNVDELAERSGVSVSSIFRYFGSLDDLHDQAFDRFIETYAAMFSIPEIGVGSLEQRIDRFVSARVALLEKTGAIMEVARARATDHSQVALAFDRGRRAFGDQIAEHFHAELAAKTGPDGALLPEAQALVVVIETLTSSAAWDASIRCHDLTADQVVCSWKAALGSLLTP